MKAGIFAPFVLAAAAEALSIGDLNLDLPLNINVDLLNSYGKAPTTGPCDECTNTYHPAHPGVDMDGCDDHEHNDWHYVHPKPTGPLSTGPAGPGGNMPSYGAGHEEHHEEEHQSIGWDEYNNGEGEHSVTGPGPVHPIETPAPEYTWGLSTVTHTQEHTVTACPPEVKDCPAESKTQYTTVTAVVQTTICPIPVHPTTESQPPAVETSYVAPPPETAYTPSTMKTKSIPATITISTAPAPPAEETYGVPPPAVSSMPPAQESMPPMEYPSQPPAGETPVVPANPSNPPMMPPAAETPINPPAETPPPTAGAAHNGAGLLAVFAMAAAALL